MAQVSFVLLARYLFTAILAADKLVFHWRGRDQSYLKCRRHTGNPVLPRSGTRGKQERKGGSVLGPEGPSGEDAAYPAEWVRLE